MPVSRLATVSHATLLSHHPAEAERAEIRSYSMMHAHLHLCTYMHMQEASPPNLIGRLKARYQNKIQQLSWPASQQEAAGGGNQVQEMLPRQNGWLNSRMCES